jgi:hypothetical protein
MNENVQITLIIVGSIVAVLLLALWMFKDRLDIFSFFASKNHVSAKMERHQNNANTILGNIQAGNKNIISAETSDSTIEKNIQLGDGNLIRATSTNQNKKKNS